eukprot:1555153-Rhodomonas_salina.3
MLVLRCAVLRDRTGVVYAGTAVCGTEKRMLVQQEQKGAPPPGGKVPIVLRLCYAVCSTEMWYAMQCPVLRCGGGAYHPARMLCRVRRYAVSSVQCPVLRCHGATASGCTMQCLVVWEDGVAVMYGQEGRRVPGKLRYV